MLTMIKVEIRRRIKGEPYDQFQRSKVYVELKANSDQFRKSKGEVDGQSRKKSKVEID